MLPLPIPGKVQENCITLMYYVGLDRSLPRENFEKYDIVIPLPAGIIK
jgi:hypothetical protein